MPEEKYVNELSSAVGKVRWLLGLVQGQEQAERMLTETLQLLESLRKREPVMKRFFHYSFEDVHYEYANLTDQEKSLCTPEQFEDMMLWLRTRS